MPLPARKRRAVPACPSRPGCPGVPRGSWGLLRRPSLHMLFNDTISTYHASQLTSLDRRHARAGDLVGLPFRSFCCSELAEVSNEWVHLELGGPMCRDSEGPDQSAARGSGLPCHPGEHLPPGEPPGIRHCGSDGRSAWLHWLAAGDADRLWRLPGARWLTSALACAKLCMPQKALLLMAFKIEAYREHQATIRQWREFLFLM